MSVFEQVKEVIVEKLGVDAAKVIPTASFVNDLGADSLDVVEFVMEVESKFNITIPDEEAGKLVTVGDAVKFIESQTAGKKEAKQVDLKPGAAASKNTAA
jgi:acyl carrier protein